MPIVIEFAKNVLTFFQQVKQNVKWDILSDWNNLAQIHEKFPMGTSQEHFRILFIAKMFWSGGIHM